MLLNSAVCSVECKDKPEDCTDKLIGRSNNLIDKSLKEKIAQ